MPTSADDVGTPNLFPGNIPFLLFGSLTRLKFGVFVFVPRLKLLPFFFFLFHSCLVCFFLLQRSLMKARKGVGRAFKASCHPTNKLRSTQRTMMKSGSAKKSRGLLMYKTKKNKQDSEENTFRLDRILPS